MTAAVCYNLQYRTCHNGRKEDMNPNTTRSTLLAVVGGYLIYLAYSLAKDLINQAPTDLPPALMIVIIVLFSLSGIGIIIYAWTEWQKGKQPKEDTDQADGTTAMDDENDCK